MEGGLQTDIKPWLVPDDAFERMDNAYIFRGRIRKRFGTKWMNSGVDQSVGQLSSRLRVQVGTVGAPSSPVPGTKFNIGELFSIGDQIYTVYQTGTPAAMLSTGPGTGTFNTTTGAFTFAGTGLPGGTAIYWYPAQPVMGLLTYQTSDSTADPTYAFDTQFAYQFTGGAWSRLGTAVWTGSDSQFFWGTTWVGALASDRLLFVVNNKAADQIKYWDGTTWTSTTFAVTGAINLETALIVVVYKNYFVALNTTESGVIYTNRARWCKLGNPLQANGWRQDIPGNGNAIDAATLEDIVSCGFIKDQLIVYFERSTWALKFTNNEAKPFFWYQINSELGAESTFSAVPFDRVLLAIGNVGVHQCDAVNVKRIDEKIPDTVWNIHTGSTNVDRVHGIRDYYAEQVYWTFPNTATNSNSSTYPNKVLVYNYKTGSWAFNDDSITTFGYYYPATQSAITWSSLDVTWDNNSILWSSGATQPLSQVIIAGNQEGYVFIVDVDTTVNAPLLQITNITLSGGNVNVNVINHNLNVTSDKDGDFLYLQYLNGLTGPFVSIYPIIAITDANNFIIEAPDIRARLAIGDVYTGGGIISRISRINILTKQFNFYIQEDRNTYVQKVDFLVDRTASGEITIDYSTSTSQESGVDQAALSGALIGTNMLETSPYTLYPFEALQARLWHPIYLQGDGTNIQLRIYLSDTEMANFGVSTSDLQIHAMTFYCVRTSSRLQ